jgi:mannose-6-phosphate isomerase-like protein (cupin superfamily)
MKNKSARVVSDSEGRALRAFGDEIVIHLDGQDTHGTLTMWTGTLLPGGGPPPHYHLNEDEAFRVLEGRAALLSCRAVLFTHSKTSEINHHGF